MLAISSDYPATKTTLTMQRFLLLTLSFLLVACAGEPLDVVRVDFPDPDISTGMTDLDAAADPLVPEHEAITLSLSFRAAEGARGRLMLDGKYPLELPSLQLAGNQPQYPATASAGIWHDLEVQYLPADGSTPALAPAVYLDGNPVYYQQVLPANDAADGPLSLVIDEGTIDITDARYAAVAGRPSAVNDKGIVELNIPLLQYDYYHIAEGSTDFNGWDSQKPRKSGYINRVDLAQIREKNVDYALRFTGKLNVPEAGNYYFRTWGTGKNDFFIDGKPVAGHPGLPDQRMAEDSIRLAAGDHDVELRIVQHKPWNVSNIAYRKLGGPREKDRFLNAMESGLAIATPASPTPRELKTDDEPFLLRSFLYFPAPRLYEGAEKRTHVISVGEGDGPHYSVDLQTGALLQVWRGRFADVNDMWSGRGEPQVMRPLGAAVQFDGAPLTGPSTDQAWPKHPDFPEDDDFHHLSHELDAAGRPTFSYDAGEGLVTDKIVPDGTGLLREITHSAGGNTSQPVQVVAARHIEEVAPGEFILRGPGLRLRIESYDGSGLTLQRSGGLDRLLAELPAKGHIRYKMDW